MLSPKILKQINKYPLSFYSYEDGLALEDKQIREMLVDVAETLKTQPYCYHATGNAIVFGFKSSENDVYDYEFIVATNYRTAIIHDLNVFEANNIDTRLNAPKDFFDI